jgi:ribose/xylose/arabinose/galactoside ABC-type transport system permease subunit
MVEWLGQLLAAIPGWLYLPVLIIVILIALVWWLGDITIFGNWPFATRVEGGEKKYDKK